MLIVVQGGSATGKTQLAQRLSKDLNIGILAKDDIKELLFDKLGLPEDVNRSIVYGKATIRAFFDILDEWLKADAGRDLIVESAFATDYADDDFRKIEEKYNPDIVQLYVKVDPEERKRRSQTRVADGSRHPGHLDTQRSALYEEESEEQYRPLAIERTITVDTTVFKEDDYLKIVDAIKGEYS